MTPHLTLPSLLALFEPGLQQAAHALGEIVGEPVTMSAPTLRCLPRLRASTALAAAGEQRLCGVRQHYQGGFRTDAVVMFAEDKCLDLVRLMVGAAVPMEELTAMEQEAMGEVGNIVLNSCVGTLANLLGQELRGSLPLVQIATAAQLLAPAAGQGSAQLVMLLQIDLVLEAHCIVGHIAFMLEMDALAQLQALAASGAAP